MSTQPIDRRRPRLAGPRPEMRRLLTVGAMFALVFAAAFAVGHTRSGSSVHERLPPSLPGVANPVPSALPAAPSIELGVAQPPTPVQATPATVSPALTPTVTEPAPTVTEATPTVTEPAPVEPAPTPAPAAKAPTKPSGSSNSNHGGSGSGTSFESSE